VSTPALSVPIEDLSIGITVHDPESGDILAVNEELERLYGYSESELRQMNVEDYTANSIRFTQEEAVRKIRAAADGDVRTFEWQVERANGEFIWVFLHLSPTTIDGEQRVIAEVRDITEYKERERRLRLFSRVIRHNLRNEMNLLQGYANRLKQAVEEDTLEDEVETILDIATEVASLSDSLDEFEEIADADSTQRGPTNLRKAIQGPIKQILTEYPEVELTVETAEDVWTQADKGLQYAVRHALENAVEHNDQDPPIVTVSVFDDPENERGVIRISDNGPSIPEMEIDILDEEIETSSVYHGSGVGLWVMQWCVRALGGELLFDKNTPRGNVVSFLLPKTEPPGDES